MSNPHQFENGICRCGLTLAVYNVDTTIDNVCQTTVSGPNRAVLSRADIEKALHRAYDQAPNRGKITDCRLVASMVEEVYKLVSPAS
jgi:hypothetical protein